MRMKSGGGGAKAAALSCLCLRPRPLGPLLPFFKFALGSLDPTQINSSFPQQAAVYL